MNLYCVNPISLTLRARFLAHKPAKVVATSHLDQLTVRAFRINSQSRHSDRTVRTNRSAIPFASGA